MSNSSCYPCGTKDASVRGVITLSSDKLATWAQHNINASMVIQENVLLYDASGAFVPASAKASTASFAIWTNLATLGQHNSKLATTLREAAGRKGTSEVHHKYGSFMPGTAESEARLAKMAEACQPFVQALVEPATPVKAEVSVKAEVPVKASAKA